MKINKTLIAALMLTFTLASCDSVVKNENQNAPVVETPADGEVAENADVTGDVATTDEMATTDEAVTTDDMATTEDSMTDAVDGAETDMAATEDTMVADGDVRAALEQAIFDNRSQARAIEILFELTPENVAEVRPELERMLSESNALLAEAQEALDALNTQ